jgi:hypothetical protein
VTERADAVFDLVVVTNVLPYFTDEELALALADIRAMLAGDGVLLHNERVLPDHEVHRRPDEGPTHQRQPPRADQSRVRRVAPALEDRRDQSVSPAADRPLRAD